jgi:alpha-L-fucosidase 2
MGTPEDLEEIRKLLREGNHVESDRMLVEKFSRKSTILSHQTLGDLSINFHGHEQRSNYSRWLSLDSAIVTSHFVTGMGKITQKVFASNPDNVLVVNIKADFDSGMTFDVELSRPNDGGHPTAKVTAFDNKLVMEGMVTQHNGRLDSKPYPVDHGVKFLGELKVRADGGRVLSEGNRLRLENVNEATLLFIVSTSFYHSDLERTNAELWNRLSEKSFDGILEAHLDDYRSLYTRVELDIKGAPEFESLPVNVRLENVREGGHDPALEAMLFQYGRYLLISSSRPGASPANLQGLWNRAYPGSLGCRLSSQHKPSDELLAGGSHQSQRMPRAPV